MQPYLCHWPAEASNTTAKLIRNSCAALVAEDDMGGEKFCDGTFARR